MFVDAYRWTTSRHVYTFDPSKVAGGTRTSCVSPSPPHVHTPPPSVRAILEETPHADMISARVMRDYNQKSLGNHVFKSAKSTLCRITMWLGATDTSNPQMGPWHVLFIWLLHSEAQPRLDASGVSQIWNWFISLLFKKSWINQKQMQTIAKIIKKYSKFIIYRAHNCNVL